MANKGDEFVDFLYREYNRSGVDFDAIDIRSKGGNNYEIIVDEPTPMRKAIQATEKALNFNKDIIASSNISGKKDQIKITIKTKDTKPKSLYQYDAVNKLLVRAKTKDDKINQAIINEAYGILEKYKKLMEDAHREYKNLESLFVEVSMDPNVDNNTRNVFVKQMNENIRKHKAIILYDGK